MVTVAFAPITVELAIEELLISAAYPIAVLLPPVFSKSRASLPTAVLFDELLSIGALFPNAILLS